MRCAFRASARSSAGAFSHRSVSAGIALVRPGIPREIVVLLAGAARRLTLVSVHTWWARYGPQLWWLPIIAVLAGLAVRAGARRVGRLGLAALLLINAVLVGVAHFQWEIEATHTTYEQMALLRQKGEIKGLIFSISASRSASGCARRASPSAACGDYPATTPWN